MLERNKKPLYYCRRLTPDDEGYQENMETFEAPVIRYLNFRTLDAEMMLQTVGEVNTKNLIAKQLIGGDPYVEGDRCYVYVDPPETSDPLCAGADFKVSSVLPMHRVEEIVFERMASES
jgi:hypothetical protein